METELDINDEHMLEVEGYLRFAKFQREQVSRREIEFVVEDFRKLKVPDGEMFSSGEVNNLLREVKDEVIKTVDKELTHSSHSMGLLLKLLCQQAESAGLQLVINTNSLENEAFLKQIATAEVSASSKPASAFVRKAQLLDRIAAQKVSDPRVLQERNVLRNEVEEARQGLSNALQARATVAQHTASLQSALEAKERGFQVLLAEKEEAVAKAAATAQALEYALQREQQTIRSAEDASMETSSSATARIEELAAALEQAQAQTQQLQQELTTKTLEAKKAAAEVNRKLSESTPFQQMKKLMQQKSQEIVRLRKRLEKLDPQNICSAEGDDVPLQSTQDD